MMSITGLSIIGQNVQINLNTSCWHYYNNKKDIKCKYSKKLEASTTQIDFNLTSCGQAIAFSPLQLCQHIVIHPTPRKKENTFPHKLCAICFFADKR